MIGGLYVDTVDIYRRTDTGRDSLNNPTYGVPVTGAGWNRVFAQISVRLTFDEKKIEFSNMGERVLPMGKMYTSAAYPLLHEDRVVTEGNNQYIITGVSVGHLFNKVVDHYEYELSLP